MTKTDANAPERLWLSAPDSDNEHDVWFDAGEGGTEYVRADLSALPHAGVSEEMVEAAPVATMHRSDTETLFSKGYMPNMLGFTSSPLYAFPVPSDAGQPAIEALIEALRFYESQWELGANKEVEPTLELLYDKGKRARSALVPAPQAWCQPMQNGEHTPRQFIVRFEDADRGDAVFDDETEARDFWEWANDNWNCYLFGSLPLRTSAPVGKEQAKEGGE